MKSLLPIGTVVELKELEENVMIIGYLPELQDGETKDYSACIFPAGYMGNDTVVAFNHDDIDMVYFLGCINDEVQDFNEQISELEVKIETVISEDELFSLE